MKALDRHRRGVVAAWGLGAVLLVPGVANAQFVERLSLHVEGGLSWMLLEPQATEYGQGYYGAVRPGLRLAGPLGIHLLADTRWYQSRVTDLGPGVASQVGGGLTVAPWISRAAGRVLLQLELGLGITGSGEVQRNRLYFGAGAGYLVPLAGIVELGLVVRYGQIFPNEVEGPYEPGNELSPTGPANFLSLGLTLGLRARPAEAPEPPRDTDRDGLIDPSDVCPLVPMGEHPDPARPGCPLGDRDHDGVLDPEDVCPDEPQGEHPDPARRGCPLGDRDRDTIYDNVDQCPDQPEDLDGFEDVDGCPDPDNDHDGILDGADRCPLQPETRNEFQDEDGCPDEAPPRAVVVENRITINQRVHFAFDRAEIEAQSFPILDQVVTVLREHPELRRIRVEGHTDEQGGPEHNLPLSRDRARAVVDYLRRHGISRRRMVSEGFGSTRPLVEGRSEEALAQNRRVDFIIVDGASFGASYVPPAGDGRPRRHHGRHH